MAIPKAATEFRVMALLSFRTVGCPERVAGPERNMRADFFGVFGRRLEFSGFSIGGP